MREPIGQATHFQTELQIYSDIWTNRQKDSYTEMHKRQNAKRKT